MSEGPKNQDISNSHSNTSLTLKKVHLVSDDADDEVQDTLKILKVAELIDVTLLRMESKMVLKIRINKLSMMRHQRNDKYLWGFGFVSVLNMMSTSEEYFKRGN